MESDDIDHIFCFVNESFKGEPSRVVRGCGACPSCRRPALLGLVVSARALCSLQYKRVGKGFNLFKCTLKQEPEDLPIRCYLNIGITLLVDALRESDAFGL